MNIKEMSFMDIYLELVEEERNRCNLELYLESLIDKRLFEEDREELIEKINLRVNGKQQKSYSKLNEGLKMIGLNYIIIPKKSGSTRYWIVNKIEE